MRGLSLQGVLTPEDKALLLSLQLNTRRMSAGEVLWHEDADADLFCVVKEGWAYSYRNLENGSKQILKFYLPGDIIGMRDFGFSRRLAGVAMINEGVVCPFSYQQLLELFGSSALAVGIMATAVRQQALLTERLVYLGRHAAHERLAHFLYELYLRLKRIGAVEDNGFFIPISQEQMGDALGLSPVHVSRTFTILRKEGLVVRHRQHITLPNPEALAQLIKFDASYIDESLPSALSELSIVSRASGNRRGPGMRTTAD
ncbi:Crp/Fnr family transcriptional regulator [Billgrantia kenyensis]|uniref:Crp/Fnr family transcriptional regulator n=1 Tax=Billgrantia kenyensis TaxID=321266 RepID=A0A7V9W1M9_9GAMM|nr:Crp/Fnr family transcriptional regulator [Halomonas kenyensis]MBA2779414.1 Crp/Fnr family transcriptional regulator [Halomonas kenyensis]MCG6662438.1 Crp/Fnr family transcriptional regulator [Halomonas kenyensis]